eukprot:TRINITY_DN23696_c2_g2_i1.p1 TRINITY_DN23696_c2_g2~~TRINITY_DN23696_c2_g2_i1.p1  ORF type:complete len:212 (-),score=56.00 TRINITY_DN23696_c2_g2_i1:252-887(-)
MKRPATEISQEESGTEAPEEKKVQKVTNSSDFWKCQVDAIYQRRNPHKLSGVPALLEKYKGKEAVLYAKICKTYDLDPKKFYADPSAWEEYEKDVQEEEPSGEGASSASASKEEGGAVVVPDLFGNSSSTSTTTTSTTTTGDGGGVAISNLFGAPPLAGSDGKVKVPSLFGVTSAFGTEKGGASDSSDDEAGAKKPPAPKKADASAECKTQ